MPPLSCVCPHCDTTLRVKDRTYLNRPIPCPACRSLLVLAVTESEELTATLDENAVSTVARSIRAENNSAGLTWSRRLRDWAGNVTVVSWTATLLVAGMIGLLIWRSDRPRSKPPREQTADSEPIATGEDASILEQTPAIQLDVPAQLAQPIVGDVKPLDVPPADALTVVKPSPPKLAPIPVAAKLPVDFEPRLSQSLSAFRQSRAIARLELLHLLEELLGAPIRYDVDELGRAAAQLDEKIAVDLHDITVRDVLAKVLDNTGIVYVEEGDGLRLTTESIEAAEGAAR